MGKVYAGLSGNAHKVDKIYAGVSGANAAYRNLPAGYTQVDYVQGITDGCIPLDYVPNVNTKIVGVFSNGVSADNFNLFGLSEEGNSYWVNASVGNFQFNVPGIWFSGAAEPNGTVFTVTVSSSILSVVFGSTAISKSISMSEFEATAPIHILGVNDTVNGPWGTDQAIRLHSFKIYESDVLTIDLVPCFRNSNSKAGVFDVLNEVFYSYDSLSGDEAGRGNAVYPYAAREITHAYVGDGNGIARLIYRKRVFLFKNGWDNTAMTGGWTGAFTHKTNGGANYTMTRMSNDGTYIKGSFSSTDGTSEKALYVRSNNAINMTGFSKLYCRLEWYTSRASTTPSDGYFGVFNSSYTNAQTNQLEARYLAFGTHSTAKNSDYQEVLVTVNVSSVNQAGYILYDKYYGNMNAAVNVRIKEIWLE